MGPRFAKALLGAAVLVTAAVAVGTTRPATALDREEIQPGDTATGDILIAGTVDEFTMRVARGTVLRFDLTRTGPGTISPAPGLYSDDYGELPLVGTSVAHTFTPAPLLASEQVRILVIAQSGVGAYKLKVRAKPAPSAGIVGTAAAPVDTLTFGAYPGFAVTLTIKWKGPAPVTLRGGTIAGPAGTPALSGDVARVGSRSSVQSGFLTTALGDHVVALDVPAGTTSWSASVRIAGRLPAGTARDFRRPGSPSAPAISFVNHRSLTFLPNFPSVAVTGEFGGPNDILLSATNVSPEANFVAGGNFCSRTPAGDAGAGPTKFTLECSDGYLAEIDTVTRLASTTPPGRIASYEAPVIRSPQGTGSSALSGFTYDDLGRPTGWSEVRRFDASGRRHELVFSRAEYFANGFCKAFRVLHRLLPDGVVTQYDFAPIN